VPLGRHPDLSTVGGLPWCSVVTLRAKGESLYRVVGPAIRKPGQWALPVMAASSEPSACEKEASKLRRGMGLEPTRV
jgi:hypothetical protein